MKNKTHRFSAWRWSKESIRFYRWRHLVFAVTAALTAAIISAALSAGESLQAGLQRDLHLRLGKIRSALILKEGLFPASLADRLGQSEASLMLRGEILNSTGIVCADKVNILGVPETGNIHVSAAGSVAVNNRAAELLNSFGGGAWSYRFERPSQFSVELPLGATGEQRLERRAVSHIRSFPSALMPVDFDTSPTTVLPINVRVPYRYLAQQAGVAGMANLLLSSNSPELLTAALKGSLTLEDAGLQISVVDGVSEVKSAQVFLPSAFCEALHSNKADCSWANFHLADEFVSTTGISTPYSFVGALTPSDCWLPTSMSDDQIVVNRWLADQLSLAVGDELTMKWRRFEGGGNLLEMERRFQVCKVLEMVECVQVKERMPVLPGLAGVNSCAEWDIGMPMDQKKLNDPENEAYWKEWQETPKALITFAAGKELFGSYFGEAMSVRVRGDQGYVESLVRGIEPSALGFNVRALWQEGVAAARGSTDFRGLFIGMAFILMVSALILAGLSLTLILDSRKIEPALFSALGIRRARVVTMLCWEWIWAIVTGAVVGALLGTLLARSLVWTLSRFWSDAFAGASISFYLSWQAVIFSALMTVILLTVMLIRCVYKYAGSPPVEIMRQSGVLFFRQSSQWMQLLSKVTGPLCAVGALLIIWHSSGSRQANGAFFGAGFLLMVSILFFIKSGAQLWHQSVSSGERVINDPFKSGLVRAIQSGARGRTLVMLLTTGVFLTIGMLAMKHDPADGSALSSSGSGGFVSIVYSTLEQSLAAGKDLALRVTGSSQVVPIRVRDGDEAGCMNMSVPQIPRLYGLPVSEMAQLRAFEPEDSGGLWSDLYEQPEAGVIPALAADQAMLQYSLKMKAGDEILYRGSDGKEWRIRVMGALPVRVSILQGGLIINEEHLLKMFPAEGYRMWLCDYAPYELRVNGGLKFRYPEPGVRVETAVERLRLLGRMESTYLDMFLVLGGLGLALGIFGVILVIARSVEERRYEFAVFQAVGLQERGIMLFVITEYGALIMTGLISGLLPALIAIQPAARALHSGVSWALVGGVVLVLTTSAILAVALGTLFALRDFDVSLLKRE